MDWEDAIDTLEDVKNENNEKEINQVIDYIDKENIYKRQKYKIYKMEIRHGEGVQSIIKKLYLKNDKTFEEARNRTDTIGDMYFTFEEACAKICELNYKYPEEIFAKEIVR